MSDNNFSEKLHDRLAEAQAQQAKLKQRSTDWLIVNDRIGTIQAIANDWEQCQPLQYKDTQQRKRVEKRARAFAASAAAEIRVKGGEEDARLIVAKLADAGIRAASQMRGEQWFVVKKESK